MAWGLAAAGAAPVVGVGLCAWLHARPRLAVTLAVLILCRATLAGYAAGPEILRAAHERVDLQLYQAFVAGTLLHVVFHQGRRDHAHGD